jgi:transcriptional regulator with XRE-family HTH domain
LDPETDFGQLLAQLRTDMGISQSEAARRAGVDQSLWSRIELGKTQRIGLATSVQMLSGLGKTLAVAAKPGQS